jgi:Na+-transporting NADH:ubiquinone oxidoreductase subunit NqrD
MDAYHIFFTLRSISFCVTLIDEVVLAIGYTVARDLLDDGVERKAAAAVLEASAKSLMDKLLSELIPQEVRVLVEMAIQDNVHAYMEQKGKNVVQNPLLRLIYGMSRK